MKKSLRLVSVLLVSVMLFCMLPLTSSATDNLAGKKILFFGDSLTEFGGSSRYTDVLAGMFPNSTIVNAGYRGDTTYQARLRFEDEVIAEDPDIVFICFGMNDAAVNSSGNNYKPIAAYRRNIQNFITALKNIDCDVVLMTPNPVTRTSGDYARGDHVEYCDVLRELAVLNNIGIVDMYTVFQQNGYANSTYISDGLHQTAKGHKVYADNIAAHLNAVYNGTDKAILTVNYVTEGGKKIGSYDHIGANGANVRILVPQLNGCKAISTTLTTTLATRSVDFIYDSSWDDTEENINGINRNEYKQTVLDEIDYYLDLGKNTDDLDIVALAQKRLEYLITVKGDTELIYSNYLEYTASPDPNYYEWDSAAGAPSSTLNPLYIDDNTRLTNGSKSNTDGNNKIDNYYSVWNGAKVDIMFDFGRSVPVDTFRVYCAGGEWGVDLPSSVTVSYKVNEGDAWTSLPDTSVKTIISEDTVENNEIWTVGSRIVSLSTPVTARYIKITVNATGAANCAWIDEVEVALTATDFIVDTTTPDPDDTIPYYGNVNLSAKVDISDYILIKRSILQTYTFNDEQALRADINGVGGVTIADCILCKRIILKTYTPAK